ncbi:MAG: heme-binding protein [Clostridia bacterium]|nr:heme-binding protein [Clostridia bacterium]
MSRYETAPYEVLKKDGMFEIRQYGLFLTAAVKESNIANTSGFNQVFSYISGNNTDQQKISMTIPVINDLDEEHKTTEFVMPSQFSKTGAPSPINPQIAIRKYEESRMASVTFSGTVNPEKILYYKELLTAWLAKTEWKPTGDFRLARYNSPFSLPAFRRNEILAILSS